jgi:alkyl sulfatase BDS1-like metallo-beta-lactamase superfamily hydrolase
MNLLQKACYGVTFALLFSCSEKTARENQSESQTGTDNQSSQLSQQAYPGYPGRYMGWEKVNIITEPNGAITTQNAIETARGAHYTEPSIREVAKNVWVVGGYFKFNPTVIVTKDGLIVIDTGDSGDEGEKLLEVIRKNISDKPIKTIIYTHSHYALGTGKLVSDPKTAVIIGHPKLNETIASNARAGGAPSSIPELGPVLTARAAVQFAMVLPDSGQDANLSKRISLNAPAFLPVNKPVKNKEIIKIGEQTIQFFSDYISDDYSLTMWLPEQKVAVNNFMWDGIPNLYTLRGSTFRDPREWLGGLKVIRNLNPEHLINSHGKSISGGSECMEAITNYTDRIALVYDQSIRGILHGLGPDALKYFVYTPKHLSTPAYAGEVYGEVNWFPQAIFQYQMGWYDRNPSNLHKLPPSEEARRLVQLMGGKTKVMEAARESFSKNEFAWAAQLVNYLFVLDHNDKDVRQMLADVYRKLGQLSNSTNGRNFFLAEALALEGKVTIPSVIPPRPQVVENDPAFYVDLYRVRVDPKKAENVDKVIVFNFSGTGKVGLHVRKGVVEFLPDPAKYNRASDFELTIDAKTWSGLYLNALTLDEAAKGGGLTVTKGSLEDLKAVMDLFDKFDPARNSAVPQSFDN